MIYPRLLILLLLIASTACNREKAEAPASEEPAEQETPPPAFRNERPVMTFTLTDGSVVDAHILNDQAVLILFQPDCDHCQEEAVQIRNRIDAFRDYKIYFISSQPMEVVQEFSKKYKLDNQANVFFGVTSIESVLNNYGAIAAPSIYIYSREGRLVESFEGLVDLDVVIKYL